MNSFKKAFCRVYQFCFHLALPVLPYREPKILKNVNEIPAEIKKLNLKNTVFIPNKKNLRLPSNKTVISNPNLSHYGIYYYILI